MGESTISTTEQEKHAKQLKRDLEGWREVILPLNSILLWEKNTYPLILVGTTTVLFMFFWYVDPSILTSVSVVGLLATLVDYLLPTLISNVCNADNWTGAKEKKLEEICRNVANCRLQTVGFVSHFFGMRSTRPKMYYVSIILMLSFLAWLGNNVDNLFLTYLTVTLLALLPGLEHQGILKKYLGKGTALLAAYTSSVKDKLPKDKTN